MNSTASKSKGPNSTSVVGAFSSRRITEFENHPAMPALLKELSPQAVASLFQEVGVTDATVLMSIMPTRALLRAFDESVWKSARPGLPKSIDYRDLVDWLTAWSDIDEQFLVEKLAAMDEDYLSTLLSRIVKVESASRYAVYWEDRESFVGLCEDDRERIGAYIVEPVVEQDREVVVGAVRALWSFDAQKLLSVFARLSDLPNPADSPRGSATTSQDVEFARESFGESQGFVSTEGARAFFAFAEQLTVSEIVALDAYDPETRRYLEVISRASETDAAQTNPVVADDLEDADDDVDNNSDDSDSVNSDSALIGEQPNTRALRALLEDSELLPRHSPFALLQDLRKSKERALTVALRRLA
ncbi:MAG TPA: DUF6178 family protein, partial [Steroidobacteraceae bacterium]|nr:DUF6178 family protein [Steroidobacteraceae bacterium]